MTENASPLSTTRTVDIDGWTYTFRKLTKIEVIDLLPTIRTDGKSGESEANTKGALKLCSDACMLVTEPGGTVVEGGPKVVEAMPWGHVSKVMNAIIGASAPKPSEVGK